MVFARGLGRRMVARDVEEGLGSLSSEIRVFLAKKIELMEGWRKQNRPFKTSRG